MAGPEFPLDHVMDFNGHKIYQDTWVRLCWRGDDDAIFLHDAILRANGHPHCTATAPRSDLVAFYGPWAKLTGKVVQLNFTRQTVTICFIDSHLTALRIKGRACVVVEAVRSHFKLHLD
jgi:hypothetical protein